MEHVIRFPGGSPPPVGPVLAHLAECHFPVQVRMIDGELTGPGERVPDRWQEVRLGTPGGMVTIIRRDDGVAVVTWGNADEAMQSAWNAVAWAFAATGGGQILGLAGPVSPEGFRVSASLPPEMRR